MSTTKRADKLEELLVMQVTQASQIVIGLQGIEDLDELEKQLVSSAETLIELKQARTQQE